MHGEFLEKLLDALVLVVEGRMSNHCKWWKSSALQTFFKHFVGEIAHSSGPPSKSLDEGIVNLCTFLMTSKTLLELVIVQALRVS